MEVVHRKIFGFLLFVLTIILGASFDYIGMKNLAVISVIGTLFTILYVSLETSLFFVLIFIWFQGFFKIISNYHPVVHVGADLVVMALMFKALFIGTKGYKRPPPFLKLFGLHFSWLMVIFFNPYSLSLISNIAGAKVYVSMFLLYFFGYYLVNSLADVKRIFLLFIGLASIQTLVTLYQGYYGAESVLGIHPGYAIQLNKFRGYAFRPFGLTNLPGGPSVYIYLVLPFIAYFIIEYRSVFKKMTMVSLLPLMGMALMFCQIRSAIGKAIVSVIFFLGVINLSRWSMSFKHKLYYNVGALVTASLTVVVMVYMMNYSIAADEDNEMAMDRSLSTFDMHTMTAARGGAWDRFLVYAQEIPFGAGFSRSGAAAGAFEELAKKDTLFEKNHFFSDNLFVHLLIELGFPGVIIVTTLIFVILRKGFKGIRSEKRQQLIGPQVAIWSALLAIAVGSYGAEGIVYNPESCFFWLFSGILMSLLDPRFDSESQQYLSKRDGSAFESLESEPF